MNRFRPTLESLDSRDLPSSLMVSHFAFTPSPSTTLSPNSAQAAAKEATPANDDHIRITLSDILVVSYSTGSSS